MVDSALKIISSPRSLGGARQLAQICPEIFLDVVSSASISESSVSDFSGRILAHNVVNISRSVRSRTVVYCLQSVTNSLIRNKALRVEWLRFPPLKLIANSHTGAQVLRGLGFEKVSFLYRPAGFNGETSPPALPATPAVAVYWKPDHPPMFRWGKTLTKVLNAIDAQLYVFPTDVPLAGVRKNVRVVGRQSNMVEFAASVDGLVRVCDRLDIGRSTFDFLTAGRWAVFNDMPFDELFYSVQPRKIARKVQELISQRSDLVVRERFDFIQGQIGHPALAAKLLQEIYEI